MTTINVQFTDSNQKEVTSYFACAQDSSVYPNIGTIDPSDARWTTFYNSFSGAAQQGMPAPTSLA